MKKVITIIGLLSIMSTSAFAESYLQQKLQAQRAVRIVLDQLDQLDAIIRDPNSSNVEKANAQEMIPSAERLLSLRMAEYEAVKLKQSADDVDSAVKNLKSSTGY